MIVRFKYNLFTLLFLLFLIPKTGISQNQPENQIHPAAHLLFKKTQHNFGTLYQGDTAVYQFSFRNTGKTPVLLSQPVSSCGCTVPTWPKSPILPGQSAKISVTYNTHNIGKFKKFVTIYSNAPPIDLTIKGEVVPRPENMLPIKKTNLHAVPVNKKPNH